MIEMPTFYRYQIYGLHMLFLWLKFLCIWRVPRTWALLDGINTPENMGRCVYNSYCYEVFWRNWHRGFNQWLIRYIFVPLGGSKYKKYNIWVVFTFVAIWHDININLLLWAWGICLVLIPEMMIRNHFNSSKNSRYWQNQYFLFLACFVCTF